MDFPATSTEGVEVTLQIRAENSFQRNHKRTVWCHSEECAVQALGQARYGSVTHKWPITLAQFRSTHPLSGVTKNTIQPSDSKEPEMALSAILTPEAIPQKSLRKRGRPRKGKALIAAERMQAYRARKTATALSRGESRT